jgi:hypothetical protein
MLVKLPMLLVSGLHSELPTLFCTKVLVSTAETIRPRVPQIVKRSQID